MRFSFLGLLYLVMLFVPTYGQAENPPQK